MMRRIVAVLALALLAGCGSAKDQDTSADGASPPPTERDAPATTTTTQDVAADASAAENALLTLSDFPAGWSEEPAEDDDPSNEALQNRVRDCFGPTSAELFDADASAETGKFTDPADDSTIDQRITITATVDLAEAFMAAASADGVAECLTAAYRDELPAVLAEAQGTEGYEVGDITAATLNVGDIGEESVAYRVTVPINVQFLTVSLIGDVVLVRKGRSVSGLNFISDTDPTPIEEITQYTTLAASRLPG